MACGGAVQGLLDPSEVVNGEEDEKCLFKVRAKLYRLMGKEWVEMGIGHLKVRWMNQGVPQCFGTPAAAVLG